MRKQLQTRVGDQMNIAPRDRFGTYGGSVDEHVDEAWWQRRYGCERELGNDFDYELSEESDSEHDVDGDVPPPPSAAQPPSQTATPSKIQPRASGSAHRLTSYVTGRGDADDNE
jgi:hypothetical protein